MTENNYTNEKYPLSDLTGKIIKCAIEVHKQLGNGFQEVIYQRRLAIELEKSGIEFLREQELPIFYEGIHVGTSVKLSHSLPNRKRSADQFWLDQPRSKAIIQKALILNILQSNKSRFRQL